MSTKYLTKLIFKKVLCFFILPTCLPTYLFYYSFYLNDFFQLDLFNLTKIKELDETVQELKSFILQKDNYNDKDNLKKPSITTIPYLGHYVVVFFIFSISLYLGYNFFYNGGGAGSPEIFVENSTSNFKNLSQNTTIPIKEPFKMLLPINESNRFTGVSYGQSNYVGVDGPDYF
jgi:hypothetical protein